MYVHWGESERKAYDLLIDAAKLDKAKILELTVTFGKGLVQYEAKGLVKPEPASLDIGIGRCP